MRQEVESHSKGIYIPKLPPIPQFCGPVSLGLGVALGREP